MERNMTLNELVEHRERGSSHVHLADIFHNASREPNPPEPFLSKSLLEPISKETYPLRALLEANLHDPNLKATTMDPTLVEANYINVPIVMDFRNNVNENAENMGIMSLFNNFTNDGVHEDTGSEGVPVLQFNTNNNLSDISRESRVLRVDQDLANWKEIIAMIRKNGKNDMAEVMETYTKGKQEHNINLRTTYFYY